MFHMFDLPHVPSGTPMLPPTHSVSWRSTLDRNYNLLEINFIAQDQENTSKRDLKSLSRRLSDKHLWLLDTVGSASMTDEKYIGCDYGA